jgi:uncharacterized membrane protein YedE/YeeE
MPALAALLCGFIFGWGLLISGMAQTTKVLGFLDLFGGAWDPSLAVVMAAALVVSGTGFALMRRRERPYLAGQTYWSANSRIDAPLVAGSAVFGVGWGLVGLCPGPALVNVATLAAPVIVFVAAMAAGMAAFDTWQTRRLMAAARPRDIAAADG